MALMTAEGYPAPGMLRFGEWGIVPDQRIPAHLEPIPNTYGTSTEANPAGYQMYRNIITGAEFDEYTAQRNLVDGNHPLDTIDLSQLEGFTDEPTTEETMKDLVDRAKQLSQDVQASIEDAKRKAESGGVKADSGKLPMHLIPPEAMTAMARRLQLGAEKYSERNWEKGIDYSRVYSSLMRHLLAWWGGEDIDPDPLAKGSSHLEGVLINAAFLVAYEKRKMEQFDDRPGVL